MKNNGQEMHKKVCCKCKVVVVVVVVVAVVVFRSLEILMLLPFSLQSPFKITLFNVFV